MSNKLKPAFNTLLDNYTGSYNAPVELVQYSDFQCEFSGNIYTTLKVLQEYLGDQLRFVFRHFPLANLNPLALDAAVASEAAAMQGKFWEMHDLIFKNQKYLVKSSFSKFAEEIGLDMYYFENSREHKRLRHKVINDFESGVKSGVDGTPTFFINGRRYNGFVDFESLLKTCRFVNDFDRSAVPRAIH